MSDQIIKELQAIHREMDRRYMDEAEHRKATNNRFDEVMKRLDEIQPVLEVYKTGLSWSTGAMWLTKLFMKVIGGIGVIAGTILGIIEVVRSFTKK